MSPYQASSGRSGTRELAGKFADFSGGFVDVPQVRGISSLNEKQLLLSQNVDISGKTIRKAKGFAKLTSVSLGGDVSTLFWDRQIQRFIIAYAGKLGQVNGTTVVQWPGATGFTNNATWSFSRVGDYLFCCNGIDTEKLYNTATTTLSNVTTPPAAWSSSNRPAFAVSWMGRIFAAGGTLNPSDIVYYCKLYDPTDWTAGVNSDSGGAFRIGNDGAPIKAMFPLDGGLLIVKDKGLYVLSGSFTYNSTSKNNDFDQTKFDWALHDASVNAVGHNAIVPVNRTLYIWGKGAVYAVTPDLYVNKFTVKKISNNIAFSVSNVTLNLENVCAIHYELRNQIWFCVSKGSASTGIDTVYIYNYENVDEQDMGGWSVRNGYSHKCMALGRDTNGADMIVSGGYTGTPYVYQQNLTQDFDGAAMECIAWTSFIPLGMGTKSKTQFCFFHLGTVTNAPIEYGYAYDYNNNSYDNQELIPDAFVSTYNSSGTSTYGQTTGSGTTGQWVSGQSYIRKLRIFGKGRCLQHRFYSKVLGSDFDILELEYGTTVIGYA